MKIVVTWAAWFVGNNLIKKLLDDGHHVTWIDNFTLWKKEFLTPYENNINFKFIEADLLIKDQITACFAWIDTVFHLAANSDISKGADITNIDLELGTIATYNVLESMRLHNVKSIIFASSSAVYGVAKKSPTAEDDGPLLPISLYWASKLACEWLVSAFSHNYDIKVWVYRFGNVIGRNSTHGAAYDFVTRLKNDSSKLVVLGDGNQAKPYIYIDDLVSWILYWWEHSKEDFQYFNLTTSGNSNVKFIVSSIFKHLWLSDTQIEYTGGKQWWKWDVPQVQLDPTKIESLWWKPQYSSDEAVIQWTKDIVEQIFTDK